MKKQFLCLTVLLSTAIVLKAAGKIPQPARSILVNCHNQTGVQLKLSAWALTHGVVSHHDEQNRDLVPPAVIQPNSTVQWASESSGVATGTEGNVSYEIMDGASSSFYFHWNNAFASNSYGTHYNTFNETISKGYTIFISGNHRDYNEVVDLYIGYPKTVLVPGFLPSKNAFKFINLWADFTYQIPWFEGNAVLSYLFDGHAKSGLCGGMVYTVRDYFEKKQLIPQMVSNPNDADHPVTRYIIKRLFESFTANDVSMYVKLMSPLYADTDEGSLNWLGQMGRAYVTLREEWPMIKQDIDNGHPSPIGLIHVNSAYLGDLGQNHQVMVYGYTLNTDYADLRIYDPNHGPNDNVVLRIKLQGTGNALEASYNGSKKPVYAFFRTNYELNPGTPGYSYYSPLPKVPIAPVGGGLVTGSVYWTVKTGRPKTDNINSAFTVKVTVPKYFQPVKDALPGSLETYQGQQGYFIDAQPSGDPSIELQKQPLLGEAYNESNKTLTEQRAMASKPAGTANNDPGASGVTTIKRNDAAQEQAAATVITTKDEDGWVYKITVSGLPVNVPFVMTLECSGDQGWQPGPGNTKPGGYRNYIYVVEVDPNRNYMTGRINSATGIAYGAGFECVGDWRNFNIPVKQVEVINPVIQKKNQGTVQKIKDALPVIIRKQ